MSDFDNALQNLGIAETLAKNVDEKYLIDYNRAVIYYNMQRSEQALQYAMNAKSIKDDSSINELISEIHKMSNN